MHNLLGTLPDVLKTGVGFDKFKFHTFIPPTASEPVSVVQPMSYKEPTPDVPWVSYCLNVVQPKSDLSI